MRLSTDDKEDCSLKLLTEYCPSVFFSAVISFENTSDVDPFNGILISFFRNSFNVVSSKPLYYFVARAST